MAKNQFQNESISYEDQQLNALENLKVPDGQNLTIHMFHVNHLDLLWYWQLKDTIEMCLETVRWHVEMLEQWPDARYSHTQIFTLNIVRQLDPKLFDRFKKLVDKGQIEIDSGQICELDNNIPSGESQVRNFLYGQYFIKQHFGRMAKVVINSDSFGHFQNLPQVLQKCGIDMFIFKRPRQKWKKLPEVPFFWKGLDGTSILALRFINKGVGVPSLSQYYVLPPDTTEVQVKAEKNLQAGFSHILGTLCESDSGGVTKYRKPRQGKNWIQKYSLPCEFYNSLKEQISNAQVYDGRLNYVYQGCYTTHIEEKQNCRKAENLLRSCEYLWSLVSLEGEQYPFEEIQNCWWILAYEQFHDTICGTGTPQMHKESSSNYVTLFGKLDLLIRKAQIYLDSKLTCSNYEPDIVAAHNNLECHNVKLEVDYNIQIDRYDNEGKQLLPEKGLLLCEDGQKIPYQLSDARQFQRYRRAKMNFIAPRLKSFGLSRFKVLENSTQQIEIDLSIKNNIIENSFFKIDCGTTGIIKSIFHKKLNKEFLANIENPVRYEFWPETDYIGDYGQKMEAWRLGTTDKCEVPEKQGEAEIISTGPVQAAICVKHKWQNSTIKTFITLYADCDFIDIHTEIDWHEKEVLLRLAIEPASKKGDLTYFGVPFGCEKNDNAGEVPVHGWADVSNDEIGLALLSKDGVGHFLDNGIIRSSIVRCSVGSFDPCSDSGIIKAEYRLIPHSGTFKDAKIPSLADLYMHPPIAWQITNYGNVKNENIDNLISGITIDHKNVLISAFKQSEDQKGYILRLYESSGMKADIAIDFNKLLKVNQCIETNLLEDAIQKISIDNNKIKLNFKPFEVKTLKLV